MFTRPKVIAPDQTARAIVRKPWRAEFKRGSSGGPKLCVGGFCGADFNRRGKTRAEGAEPGAVSRGDPGARRPPRVACSRVHLQRVRLVEKRSLAVLDEPDRKVGQAV